MLSTYKNRLHVKLFSDRYELGKHAAQNVSEKIKELLMYKDEINIVFAAAPSQNEFLKYLVSDNEIEWNRINAFHMDEYIGLDCDAPQSFGNFLKERIFSLVNLRSVSYINGQSENPEKECERYSSLILKSPIDIVCFGIGENGHLAFNDPHVADFKDKKTVKVVDLDIECRTQQVNDGCFQKVDEVPTQAITVTIPVLLSASNMFCVVPGKTKARAIQKTIFSAISEKCPSTILRQKENTILYIDDDSGSLIKGKIKELMTIKI